MFSLRLNEIQLQALSCQSVVQPSFLLAYGHSKIQKIRTSWWPVSHGALTSSLACPPTSLNNIPLLFASASWVGAGPKCNHHMNPASLPWSKGKKSLPWIVLKRAQHKPVKAEGLEKQKPGRQISHWQLLLPAQLEKLSLSQKNIWGLGDPCRTTGKGNMRRE